MKNLTKLATVVMVGLIFLLCGCSRTVTPEEIKWATDICENNGGIQTLEGDNVNVWAKAVCVNGGTFIKK